MNHKEACVEASGSIGRRDRPGNKIHGLERGFNAVPKILKPYRVAGCAPHWGLSTDDQACLFKCLSDGR